MKFICDKCNKVVNGPVVESYSRRGFGTINGTYCQACITEMSARFDDEPKPTKKTLRQLKPGEMSGKSMAAKKGPRGRGWYISKRAKSPWWRAYIVRSGSLIKQVGKSRNRIKSIQTAVQAAKKAGTFNQDRSVEWLKQHLIDPELIGV